MSTLSQLSLREVDHIARLARIHLSEAEKEKLQKDLSAILDFVQKLNEVDTENIPPTAQVTGLVNAFGNDESGIRNQEPGTRELLLGQVPEREGNYVKVKAVFE